MLILGIETSCDETAAAVVRDGRRILSNVIFSQIPVHRKFQGVVPELASRAHTEKINYVIYKALSAAGIGLKHIDAIAVTIGPGLIGSLLVGKTTAETMAWVCGLPVVGVNHIEAHIYAALLNEKKQAPPFLGLIVSGGHTELVVVNDYGKYRMLGCTRDDAAGEAFDKAAKMLGLRYPGGPEIDRLAKTGNPAYISFPRPWLKNSGDFSFSGLKTALYYYLLKLEKSGNTGKPMSWLKDVCASFQAAVVEVLAGKTIAYARKLGLKTVVVGGGVAANSGLRNEFKNKSDGINVVFAPPVLCTDNAAMIACCGYYMLKSGRPQKRLKVNPSLTIKNWR